MHVHVEFVCLMSCRCSIWEFLGLGALGPAEVHWHCQLSQSAGTLRTAHWHVALARRGETEIRVTRAREVSQRSTDCRVDRTQRSGARERASPSVRSDRPCDTGHASEFSESASSVTSQTHTLRSQTLESARSAQSEYREVRAHRGQSCHPTVPELRGHLQCDTRSVMQRRSSEQRAARVHACARERYCLLVYEL